MTEAAPMVTPMAAKRRRKSNMAKPLLAPPPAAAATKPFFFTTWLELLVTVLGSPTSMVVDSFAIFSCNWGLKKEKVCALCVIRMFL